MNKTFDCVEMKNAIQERLYQARGRMTPSEEIEAIRSDLRDSKSPIANWWRQLPKTRTEAQTAVTK